MKRYLLGIDVGSTTAKVALVDPDKRLKFAEYRRHFAEQGNCVRDLLTLVAEQAALHAFAGAADRRSTSSCCPSGAKSSSWSSTAR